MPIFPRTNKIFGSEFPVQSMTTQKHDFVFKYRPKRSKIVPSGHLGWACGNTETMTIQKLSFPPLYGISRTKSCKPQIYYKRPELPFANETTNKMSFMPVPIQRRVTYPWAQKPKYSAPSVTFAGDTVQKLSFQPPGCFVDTSRVEEMAKSYVNCDEKWE